MADFAPAETLREHRSLLLAMEAVGWLHMTGKARTEFLRGGQAIGYDDLRWHERETPPFPWDDLLGWVKHRFPDVDWPNTLTDLLTKHRQPEGTGLLGLLQAAHGMTSGIEKNVPRNTSTYLNQDATHMWLSSAFGQPLRNLLTDPPEVLSPAGWQQTLDEARRILEELEKLGKATTAAVDPWRDWRESAIGPSSRLRAAFSSTLAETRLPNNEVTLWDQSYVAAALFKSAVAGAVLEGPNFPWGSKLKQTTRWRLLTIGIGSDHYEARAVRIGDWLGARQAIETFFDRIRSLIEVDLAVGSLLYRDASVHVFSFPGERSDGSATLDVGSWEPWLIEEARQAAQELQLETPPICRISAPTRSLVPIVREIREARSSVATPVHRTWAISSGVTSGHVCPVCLVRYNGAANDKEAPCRVCRERRRGRLDAWLGGDLGADTIWVNELADANGRLALLTFSLDLEPWLEGSRLDSLRTQAISEWRRFNPTLDGQANPIEASQPFAGLTTYVRGKLGAYDKADPVLKNLQEGYKHEKDWPSFFAKIVEDRADAPSWEELDNDRRARWLVHQLFTKLASPGRIYRFWRHAEEFFAELLCEFRQIAASDPNRWRIRRLALAPDDESAAAGWKDGEVYEGRAGDALVNVLYRGDCARFLTTCNLARLLRPEEGADALKNREFQLWGEDRVPRTLRVKAVEGGDPLGVYHPVIPLELSPFRFRTLVPLEAASSCLDRAIAAWNERFARVWDRLPLRAGLVAFPQKLPFQAVIEAVRTLEHELEERKKETWRVEARDERSGVAALAFRRPAGGGELRTVPVTLPDGRTDVFYLYVAVEDDRVRFARDFQHPSGQVYRHVLDLAVGDGVRVQPACVASRFLDSAAGRFDPVRVRPLAEWARMRALWQLVERTAPSLSAVHAAWAELGERRQSWQAPDGGWAEGGREAWRGLVEAVLADRLGAKGAALETLVEAADDGILEWALDWHLSVLKEG